MPNIADDLNNPYLQQWYKKAMEECIERLYELGELDFDDEETGCYYWTATRNLLGQPE